MDLAPRRLPAPRCLPARRAGSPRSRPSRLLRVLPDSPRNRGFQRVSAGRGRVHRPDACPPPFLDSPFGEIQDLSVKFPQNDAAIKAIGPSIPVLLTSGDHDGVDPPVDAHADYAYYQQHCGCDVTQCCWATPPTCSWCTGRCRCGPTKLLAGLAPRACRRPRGRPCAARTASCRSSADRGLHARARRVTRRRARATHRPTTPRACGP